MGLPESTKDPIKDPIGADKMKVARDALRQQYALQAPSAYSIDGQSFLFESPLGAPVRTGSYVEITLKNGDKYFGQILSEAIAEREGPEYGLAMAPKGSSFLVVVQEQAHLRDRLRIRVIQGQGLLLGQINADGFSLTSKLGTFEDAVLSPAAPKVVDQYFAKTRPVKGALDVGTPVHGTRKCRVYLSGANFNRHTFLTGQSRSGKSFAMGVIVEQVLLETRLRVVIIDPNSDFTRLTEFRDQGSLNKVRPEKVPDTEYEKLKKRYEEISAGITILGKPSPTNNSCEPLRIRFSDLTAAEKPAVLQLDPLDNREEFHSFNTLLEGLPKGAYSLDKVLELASRYFFEESRSIGLRISNLGIRDWGIWAKNDEKSLAEVLESKQRCTVIDLGALETEQEKLMTAMVILGHFWSKRDGNEGVLVVIDEAHNVAPAFPQNRLQRICSDIAVQLAGEGLKYNIFLMVASQRPGKLNANVISQCDNQIIMRMTSQADLATVAETFSQIPSSLINKCAQFETGNALVAGRIVHAPTFVLFDGRVAEEGGGTKAPTWV